MRTLLLVRHAPTSATRASAFPADEPLDERGREQAARLSPRLPRRTAIITSPARRCRQTAEAAGLEATSTSGLRNATSAPGPGGRSPTSTTTTRRAAAWMLDPGAAPHGGDSLETFCARIARWLDAQAEQDGRVVAITHGEVIKAAVVHALGAPVLAFWRIDASPLAFTELHAHGGRWTVTRLNCAPGTA